MFAGVVIDEGEFAGSGIDGEGDDGVVSGGGLSVGDVAVGDVEEFVIGREMEIGGGDDAFEAFGMGDDVLDGGEGLGIGIPGPDTDAGVFAFVRRVDDVEFGVEDEMPGLAGVGVGLWAVGVRGIVGGGFSGGGVEVELEDLVGAGGGDEEGFVRGGEDGGVGFGFEGDFLDGFALVDLVFQFPDRNFTGAVVIAGEERAGRIGL